MKRQHVCVMVGIIAPTFAQPAGAGGPVPPNDNCSNATVIPGNVGTFNPPTYLTTGATIDSCPSNESCEAGAAGTSNSVWYSYTPAHSGSIEVNTFGSNYNTVLSIWSNCVPGSPPFCGLSTQLACNDDGVGNLSQIFFNVVAGEDYLIKVADYNLTDGGGSLDFNFRWTPPNNACPSATHVNSADYHPALYSTVSADLDSCEASESCEVNGVGVSNSVWYKFCSLENGTMTIDTNGSNYDTVLSVFNACASGLSPACSFPVQLACDDDSGTGVSSLITDFPVVAGVDYYIKVADYNITSGGGMLEFNLVFDAACPADSDYDGQININDLLDVINSWGACP